MNVELISPLLQGMQAERAVMEQAVLPAAAMPQQNADFAAYMKQAVSNMDGLQHNAANKAEAVESGQSDDLIGAMLAGQEASLSFSLMMQVRNKLMMAFDDVIKMQV